MITYPASYTFKGLTIELSVANGEKWTTIKVSGFPESYFSLLFRIGWKSPGLEEKILVLYCQLFEVYDGTPLEQPVFTTNIKVTNQNGEFDKFFAIRMDGKEQLQQVLNAFLNAMGGTVDEKNDELAHKAFTSYCQRKGITNPFGYRVIEFIPTGVNPKDEWSSTLVEPLDYSIATTDETVALNDGSVTLTITNQQSGKTPEFKIVKADGTVVRDFSTSLSEGSLAPGEYEVWSQYQDAHYLPDGVGGLIKMRGFKKPFTINAYVAE